MASTSLRSAARAWFDTPIAGDLATTEVALRRAELAGDVDVAWLTALKCKGATRPNARLGRTAGGELSLDIAGAALVEHAATILAQPIAMLTLKPAAKDVGALGKLGLRHVHTLGLTGSAKPIAALLRAMQPGAIRALQLIDLPAKSVLPILDALVASKLRIASLDLTVADEPDAVAPHLAACPALSSLRRLRFRGTPGKCGAPFHPGGPAREVVLTSTGLAALAEGPWPELETLVLHNVEDAAGSEALCRMAPPRLRSLTILDVMESAGTVLAERAPWASLQSLSLGYIDQPAVVALASNPALAGLRRLHVNGLLQREAPLGDRGFAAIIESPHWRGLELLSLCYGGLTDDAMAALRARPLEGLAVLDLYGSVLSPAGWTELAEASLPALHTLRLSLSDHATNAGDNPRRVEALARMPLARAALLGACEGEGDAVVEALVCAPPKTWRVVQLGGSNLPSMTTAGARRLAGHVWPSLELLYVRPRNGGLGVSKAAEAELAAKVSMVDGQMPLAPPHDAASGGEC